MTAYVIKFQDGTYYAGYGKSDAKTLLGAQLYQSEKRAQSVIRQSNLQYEKYNVDKIVAVELKEIDNDDYEKAMAYGEIC